MIADISLRPVKLAVMLRKPIRILKPHEHLVSEALVSGIIPAATMFDIKNDPNISSFNVTGNGYFITIQHPNQPMERIVCDTPMVLGECDGVETGKV